MESPALGAVIVVAIALHNIPEGICIAMVRVTSARAAAGVLPHPEHAVANACMRRATWPIYMATDTLFFLRLYRLSSDNVNGLQPCPHTIPNCPTQPIYYSTGSRWKALLYCGVAGMAEPVGGLLGWAVLSRAGTTPLALAVMFSIVAGMMVFVALVELLPTALKYDPNGRCASAWAEVWGYLHRVCLGLVFSKGKAAALVRVLETRGKPVECKAVRTAHCSRHHPGDAPFAASGLCALGAHTLCFGLWSQHHCSCCCVLVS